MDRARFLTRQRRYIASFSSAAIIVFVGVAVAVGIRHVLERQAEIRRSESIIRVNDDLLQRLTDAETSQRGYIIVGDPGYLAPYAGGKAEAIRASRTLRDLVADDPTARRLQQLLDSAVSSRLSVLDKRVDIRGSAGFDSARESIIAGGGKTLMDSARQLSAAIERRYVARQARQISAQVREARILFAVLVLGTTLAALVALLLNGMLGRVATVQQTVAARLSEQNEQLRAQADELQRHQALLKEQSAELEVANQDLEERTAEAERLRNEAEAANRSKSAYLAMMSHDLRTPLNAIGGYAALMEAGIGGELSDTQKDYVARVRSSNRFLIALIDDVLNFAKTEVGETVMRNEPVLVGEFLSSIEPMIAPQINDARLAYGVTRGCGTGSCGSQVFADPEKLRQIILNLVSNAIKFTPAGGDIELRCNCDERYVWIAVRDTGRGIPADKLEDVFKPFLQLDRGPVGGRRGGVGLGLAISRELARRMGGDLTVTSAVGAGSTFTLRFTKYEHSSAVDSSAAPIELRRAGDRRSLEVGSEAEG